MSEEAAEHLVKVRVNLPDQNWPKAESFWAEALGDDLYRLRNRPFYAYDLHFLDVVRAIPAQPGAIPTIVEVVRRSGHKTLRVVFAESTSNADVQQTLASIAATGVDYERATGQFYALDVHPEADYQAVCDELYRLELVGTLHYETGTTAG